MSKDPKEREHEKSTGSANQDKWHKLKLRALEELASTELEIERLKDQIKPIPPTPLAD